ncbi:hypothetical protein N0V93_000370 [Gnomoniopsis smithogilvyi]|uniref:DUF1308 domain-containing protein n=1 Tax=Gnomoniopsis smithogilvyi TaxID=1191159 RepID=A0A9W9D060_9PEZI|nr:hypothetical protein N0V93_000370 [Gnomoniopsis smithogilvyi]
MEKLRQALFALHGDNQHISGLATQISSIITEKAAAEAYLAFLADENASWKGNAEARFRSNNIPAVQQVWNIVKKCRHITSVQHRVVVNPRISDGNKASNEEPKPCSKGWHSDVKRCVGKKGMGEDGVLVNAVVEGGAEWLKVISKTEKRLLHELAEAGWDWGMEDEESDGDKDDDDSLFEDIEILRTATLLVKAARTNWHKYKHPRIRFVFTRIREGHNKEVDRLISKLRLVGGTDINVDLHFADSEWVSSNPLDIDSAIANLLPQIDDLTDPVLLDTSVLIALSSDISHTRVDPQVYHEADVLAQIKAEQNGLAFLWRTAYPHIRGRKLICTKEAAKQFTNISETIGSSTEVERARLLLHGRRGDLQRLSLHPVPEDLILPVQVLPDEETNLSVAPLVQNGSLLPVAMEVQKHLYLPENQGTHLYGWVSGLTVITGNRVLAGKIVQTIEQNLQRENNNRDYDNGPRICALPQNRALATKGPSYRKACKLARRGLWPPVNQEEHT